MIKVEHAEADPVQMQLIKSDLQDGCHHVLTDSFFLIGVSPTNSFPTLADLFLRADLA